MAQAPRDQNFVPTLLAVSSADGTTPVAVYADPTTHRLLTSAAGGAAPADAQYVTLAVNATLTNERVLTGTANQITITDNGAGSTVVLSLPQSIATSSTPTFASMSLTAASSLTLGTSSSAAGGIIFKNATNANTLTVTSGVTSASYSLTLPTAQGAASTFLKNDGAGALSWATPTASPGGSNTQVQYNNAGALGGITGATTDGTTLTLVAPVLGAATATSINKVTITAPATGSTLTIADGKTLTVSDTMTLAGPNGSGNVVFTTSPTLVTPTLGVASATSINKVAITAPATSATLTIADGKTVTHNATTTFAGTDGKTLTISKSLTLDGTDSTTMTFPTTSATIARTDAAQTFTGVQSMTSPDITTSLTTPSTTFSLVNATATTVNFAGAATTMAIGASTALVTLGGNIIFTSNAITATANAATVPITHRINTVTNNSAATLTITMTTTSAVDGQLSLVRILDFSAVAQTITWVNTENSTVTAPTTSNGSTTLPLTVGFQYNNATSKWRCIASA